MFEKAVPTQDVTKPVSLPSFYSAQDILFFLGCMWYSFNGSKLPPDKKYHTMFSTLLCRIKANTAADIILYSRPSPGLQRIAEA
jgi:hypothetical protein